MPTINHYQTTGQNLYVKPADSLADPWDSDAVTLAEVSPGVYQWDATDGVSWVVYLRAEANPQSSDPVAGRYTPAVTPDTLAAAVHAHPDAVAERAKTEAINSKLPADTAEKIGLIEVMRGTDGANTEVPPTPAQVRAVADAALADAGVTAQRQAMLDRDLAHAGDAASYRADLSSVAADAEAARAAAEATDSRLPASPASVSDIPAPTPPADLTGLATSADVAAVGADAAAARAAAAAVDGRIPADPASVGDLPDISGLSTFDPASDAVITDDASRLASRADVSAISSGSGLSVSDSAMLRTVFDRTGGGRLVATNASPGAVDGGSITLVQGDDYTAGGADADPVSTHTPASAVAYAVSDVQSAELVVYDEQSGEVTFSSDGSVRDDSLSIDGADVATLRFEAAAVTRDETLSLRRGANSARYAVAVTLAGGLVKTLARGVVDVE